MYSAAKAAIEKQKTAPPHVEVSLPDVEAVTKAAATVEAVNKALLELNNKTVSLTVNLKAAEDLIQRLTESTNDLDVLEQRILLLLESKLKEA